MELLCRQRGDGEAAVAHAMTSADCDEYFKTEDEKRPQQALAKRLAEVREDGRPTSRLG